MKSHTVFDVIEGPGGPCGFDMMWDIVGFDSVERQVLIMWVKSLKHDNR